MLAHAVDDHLVFGEQLQRLLVAVEELLDAAYSVQLVGPLQEREPEGILWFREKISGSERRYIEHTVHTV